MSYTCEHCQKEVDTKYGSGRFCSERCARQFAAMTRREETNIKVSKTLTGRKHSPETIAKIRAAMLQRSAEVKERIKRANKDYWQRLTPEHKAELLAKRKHATVLSRSRRVARKSLSELSSRTITKVLQRMELGCLICGWNIVACDVHHIRGRKCENAESMSNLTYLCPNCHRLVHAGVLKTEDLVSLEDAIGESWRDFYFC